MTCTIWIDGVLIPTPGQTHIQRGSISIEKRIEERSIASFVVVDELATKVYLRGMPVEIYSNIPIDVGSAAIDRGSSISPNYTVLDLANAANDNGSITSIEVWAATNMTGLRVGTFYLISGTTYKCRDSAVIGNVVAGSKQIFTGLSIVVHVGDYIGAYWNGGTIEGDITGGSGRMAIFGEYIDPGDQSNYTFSANRAMSLYAIGIVKIFAGFIDTPERVRLAPGSGLLHSVSCMDNHYLADKRLVVKSYQTPGQTLADIVNDIFTDYLAAEGITIGAVQTGPTIQSAIFNYVKVSDAFDALKELSGFTWFIDESKRLYFIDRATYASPWQLDNVTHRAIQGSVHLSTGNPMYRNKQYVRGGTGITSPPPETFTGDGVTVAFTVGYPIAAKPVITVGGVAVAPALIGIKGIDSGMTCYWNKGDATITFAVAPAAVPIVVDYDGLYPLISLATNFGGIVDRQAIEGGGSGIVEDIVTEVQHESSAAINESAKAKLIQYCQVAEKFIYQPYESGLAPGQLQEITYSPFGFTAHQMLIESVSITADGDTIYSSVSCITGPSMGSWAKFFSGILLRQDSIIKIGDSRLLVLLQQVEALSLVEATDFHSDAFPPDVSRWIALPPAQGAGYHIRHEALALAETIPALVSHDTEDYTWEPDTGLTRWDFFTYA